VGDNLAELLYTAWRSERFAFEPDLPSWGNVRDPDVRLAWEAAANVARRHRERVFESIEALTAEFGAEQGLLNFYERWQR
jgi:hypothetical protein